jgi:MFS transporter, DHA1 family, tetracycline resistance protein
MMRQPGPSAQVFVLVTVLLDATGFGIVLPVLPKLIVALTGSDLAAAASYAGWIGFTYAAAMFLCAPLIGALSDRFGRRPVLLIALAGLVVNYAAMALAPTIGWLFAGRLLSGAGGATVSVANAYTADVTPSEDRAKRFGLIGAMFGLGFILGPVAGGLLAQYGVRVPFVASAVLALANLAYGALVLPETLAPENRRAFAWTRAHPLGALARMRRYAAVSAAFAVVFLYQFALQTNPNIFPYYLMRKYGWSERDVGISLAVFGVILVIVQGALTPLFVRRLGPAATVRFALAVAAVAALGFAFAPAGWAIYAWLPVFGLVFLTYPALQAIMTERVGADAQGELQGVVASLTGLVAVVTPPLVTQQFSYFSAANAPVYFPGAPFVSTALALLAALAIFSLGVAPGVARTVQRAR